MVAGEHAVITGHVEAGRRDQGAEAGEELGGSMSAWAVPLRLILKVIGIDNVTVVAGGNAKAVDMGQMTREEFLQKFDLEVAAAARA